MTAKEFVRERFPKAHAERHRQGNVRGMCRTYWLIRIGRENMYFAEGKTESNAWVNAMKRIKSAQQCLHSDAPPAPESEK